MEKDMLIPSLMRKTAENVDCKQHVDDLAKCFKKFSENSSKYSLMVFKECKIENTAKLNCIKEKLALIVVVFKLKYLYTNILK